MSSKHDPSKARRHWVYSRNEVRSLYDVSDGTISNWIRAGLKPIDSRRPQLLAGYKLRQFLTKMRWPDGRSPQEGRLFCSTCIGFKALITGTIKTTSADMKCISVTGMCTDCHNMLEVDLPPDEMPEVFAASINIPGDSSDVIGEAVSGAISRNGASIPTETSSSNLRWLYDFRIYLESNRGWDARTVDEYLRAAGRMSAFLGHKPFEQIGIADVRRFKDELRRRRELGGSQGLSWSTVLHTLDRCGGLFRWLQRRPAFEMDPDLPGYFRLARKERAAEAGMVKGTSLTFDKVLYIFATMPASTPIELRDRAIVAMFIVTGIRVAALITLRGKHVNTNTRWVNQDPREVSTKLGKHIRTYCLDLGSGLLDAIQQWARWRGANGFDDEAPFFVPDRYIQPNGIGLGYRPAEAEATQCWKSDATVQRIIKDAARAAGIPEDAISSHDFRKVLHPFLSKRGKMQISEEVALQLNLGHTPQETIRRHYASMQESEREELLDDLCRRALSLRSEVELYAGYHNGRINEADPDYARARVIYQRYAEG